jgi:Zn-dependent protease with chaperone function
MRSILWVWLALVATSAQCEGIEAVLQRSQQTRLDSMKFVDTSDPRALTVRESFDKVVQVLALHHPVELRIIEGPTVAETVQGHIVLANQSLADAPESERLFILAHELGHVEMEHWRQVGRLYLKYVPGEVTQDKTDPVAGALGRDASAQAYQHEFDADAFGMRVMSSLGFTSDDVLAVFRRQGLHRDTPTHPGTHRRIAALRALDSEPSMLARAAKSE